LNFPKPAVPLCSFNVDIGVVCRPAAFGKRLAEPDIMSHRTLSPFATEQYATQAVEFAAPGTRSKNLDFCTSLNNWGFNALGAVSLNAVQSNRMISHELTPDRSELPGRIQSKRRCYPLACVDNAIVFENVSNTGQSIKIEGREMFAQQVEQAATVFASRHQSVRTAVVSGDMVALEIDWTGTPAVDFGPMKAGETVSIRGASFITIANGKLVRIVDIS
jgi:ketosteroid isomerase-like protein